MSSEPPQDPRIDLLPWAGIASQLAALMRSVGDISPDLHRRVPSDDLWQFKALIDRGRTFS